jgi:hypothetical protein
MFGKIKEDYQKRKIKGTDVPVPKCYAINAYRNTEV